MRRKVSVHVCKCLFFLNIFNLQLNLCDSCGVNCRYIHMDLHGQLCIHLFVDLPISTHTDMEGQLCIYAHIYMEDQLCV